MSAKDNNPFSPLGLSPLDPLSPFGPAPPGTAAALEILKPMLEMTQHFSQAERDQFWKAVPVFGEAIGKILNFFGEAEREAERRAHIHAALRIAAKYGGYTAEADRQRAEISELKKEQLINLIALVCFAYADISSVAPAAAERLRDELRAEIKKSQARKEAAHARAVKAAVSKRVDDLISHHAIRKLKEKKHAKKKKKPTAYRVAVEIRDDLRADLVKGDLEKLGVKKDELDISATAKRIRKLKILDR